MSFVIFLYADGLIQWTNGLITTHALVGVCAVDEMNTVFHPLSHTPEVINIASSRVPDNVMVDGMVMYRVDRGKQANSKAFHYIILILNVTVMASHTIIK